MLKTVYEKWEELKSLPKSDNKEIIAKYYLGKKSTANVFFSIYDNKMSIYVEFTKEVLADLDVPTLKGMYIGIVNKPSINPDKKYLLVRNDTNNEEIFEAFSSSLTDGLANSTSYFDTYQVFKSVVKEYKDYFSNPIPSLTKQEEQGLCAELMELDTLIKLKGENVVNNWQGPAKNKRDFVFDKVALEIKSTLNQENTAIRITNENQLNSSYPSSMDHLFLKIYIMEDSDIGICVNSCIDTVIHEFASIPAKTAFLANLAKLKINPTTFKSKYHFTIQKEITYEILADFPAITSKTIPSSVFDISYRLKIDDISAFKIQEDKMNDLLQ